MKTSKVIPVRETWFFDRRRQPMPPEMGVALLVGAAFALGSWYIVSSGKLAHASQANLVTVPAYSDIKTGDKDSDEYPKSAFKYQYEAASDEKPILHKKAQKKEISGGAEYDDGDEWVVELESEELAVSLAPIVENEGESEVQTSAPSPSPTPSPKAAQRNIGKRTAEVR